MAQFYCVNSQTSLIFPCNPFWTQTSYYLSLMLFYTEELSPTRTGGSLYLIRGRRSDHIAMTELVGAQEVLSNAN